MEQSLVLLEKLDAKNLPELKGIEESQLKLVEENPYIEIVDNKTYEEAKKRRTALLKGRTSLESQEKTIASKLSNFRKQVSSVTKELIDITLPHEEKQQEEVKRYEQIKENERLEKERLENERIEKIKFKISELETKSYEIINSWDVDVLQNAHNSVFAGMDTDFDFEEFDILYQQAKLRVQEYCENKINSLQEKENQRIENERLRKEKEESDAKLKAIQDQQEKEREEREAKERIEKEQMFEVRKNRLAEIGIVILNDFSFHHKDGYDVEYYKETIYNADIIDFENILTDAKKTIKNAKENYEKLQAEKESREKAEIEAKKKADKENKERQKRLSLDKKIISESLEVYFADLHFATENKETKYFIENANIKIQNLKTELLTELENL